jgi:hypothetical protein
MSASSPASGTLRAALMAYAALGACKTQSAEQPTVKPGIDARAGRVIDIQADGSFTPGCAVVRTGQTVGFLNSPQDGALPADVTSLKQRALSGGEEEASGELYSPNLQAPAATSWTHRFTSPGIFNFVNSAVGIPGRKVVDDYYGTVTFVPVAGSGGFPTGTICVHAEGEAAACDGVCCPRSDVECRGRTECIDQQCKEYPRDECRRPGDCQGGLVCGPKGRCIAECRSKQDCALNETCVDAKCARQDP